MDLCDKRRELKTKKHQNPIARQEHAEVNHTIRIKMSEAKENWISNQYSIIDKSMKEGNSKIAYDTLKIQTRNKQA